jgi:hypothetical protein
MKSGSCYTARSVRTWLGVSVRHIRGRFACVPMFRRWIGLSVRGSSVSSSSTDGRPSVAVPDFSIREPTSHRFPCQVQRQQSTPPAPDRSKSVGALFLFRVGTFMFDDRLGALFAVVLPGVGTPAFHICGVGHALTMTGLAPVGGMLFGQAQSGFDLGLGLGMPVSLHRLPVPIPNDYRPDAASTSHSSASFNRHPVKYVFSHRILLMRLNAHFVRSANVVNRR